MAVNWLQNRLITNELRDPVLFLRSVVSLISSLDSKPLFVPIEASSVSVAKVWCLVCRQRTVFGDVPRLFKDLYPQTHAHAATVCV